MGKKKTAKTVKQEKDEILDALKKKAKGYRAEECVEEMAIVDGRLELVKRKVSVKDIPPDVSAAKLLLEGADEPEIELSEEELLKERDRLMKLLKEEMGK